MEYDNPEIGPPFSITTNYIEQSFSDRKIQTILSKEVDLKEVNVHAGKITWMKSHLYFIS